VLIKSHVFKILRYQKFIPRLRFDDGDAMNASSKSRWRNSLTNQAVEHVPTTNGLQTSAISLHFHLLLVLNFLLLALWRLYYNPVVRNVAFITLDEFPLLATFFFPALILSILLSKVTDLPAEFPFRWSLKTAKELFLLTQARIRMMEELTVSTPLPRRAPSF